MKSLKLYLVTCVVLAMSTASYLQAATPEESFRKSYPNVALDSFTPTAIPGLYEVVSSFRIGYYNPQTEYLLFGDLVTRDGRNLTDARTNEILAKKFEGFPLDKAIKIGSGPHRVIEITDPDCPYCRKASEYLATRKDVTRYVFFYALSIHPKAEPKVRYAFCAADRAQAAEEAMAGKLDEMKFTTCQTPEVDELMKLHREIGDRIWITQMGTPLFLIDGKVVRGANVPLMEQILGAKQSPGQGPDGKPERPPS
jgi:thiol:disulfide interchange protein DsbC